MARIDAEYQTYLDGLARQAFDRARADLPIDVTATFTVHRARSAPSGLFEVAGEHDATAIALGSSTAGMFGRIALGSVTNRLLHSSRYPVAMATRGLNRTPQSLESPSPTAGPRRPLADDERVAEWAASIEVAAHKATQRVKDVHPAPSPLEVVIGYGEDWDEVLYDIDWQEGDILTVGSSSVAPVARCSSGPVPARSSGTHRCPSWSYRKRRLRS